MTSSLFLVALLTVAAPSGPSRLPEPTFADADLPDGDESLSAAQAALAKAPDELSALRALVTVVNLQRRRGDYQAGLSSAREGLAKAQQLGDLRLQVDFLYLIGRLQWNLANYPRSIEVHLEELKLSESLSDPFLLARTHSGLGITYARYGRQEDALYHFQIGLEHAARAPDDRMRGSLLNSLANYHLGQGDYAQAAALHVDALRIRERAGNRRAVAETLTNLGLAADGLGDHALALSYLRRALATFEALRYRRNIANTHRWLARVYRNAGQLEESLEHVNRALAAAATLDTHEVLADVYQEAALTHEARGDLGAALAAERQSAASREAMGTEQMRDRMAELREGYAAEQRELEIVLLRREQELQQGELARRRLQTAALGAGLIGGFALLGAVIVVQLGRLRAQRRMQATTEHARERAETAERLKSRLLQMASHDLKVPLTALHATAGTIARTSADPELRELAASIQADTARMRSLVHDFLDASAIEDGNLHLQADSLDLAELAHQAVASLQPVAAERGQRLSVADPARALPLVRADAGRLRQVFDNLIGNALKFTPAGGDIELSFGQSGAWAFVEVKDSGPGLGPEDFARIFASEALPIRPAGSRPGDSTGLGLFIVRELLTLQGGRLEVRSLPGQGSVFRVLLPNAPAPAMALD
jgi:signal transduction histidine kinase